MSAAALVKRSLSTAGPSVFSKQESESTGNPQDVADKNSDCPGPRNVFFMLPILKQDVEAIPLYSCFVSVVCQVGYSCSCKKLQTYHMGLIYNAHQRSFPKTVKQILDILGTVPKTHSSPLLFHYTDPCQFFDVLCILAITFGCSELVHPSDDHL